MQIVRRPRQHTMLASLILLSTPIFALNVWVMQKGVLAKVIQPDKLVWGAVQAGWMLLTLHWLMRLRWRGFWSVVAMSIVLLVGNVHFLFATKNYALAFYGLFLLILAALYCMHLFKSLGEAYYRSGQRWFEGRPRFLPRIEAQILVGDVGIPVRLSRLGVEGCYAYPGSGQAEPALDSAGSIALKLGDLRLETAVELVSRSKDGLGRGLRFVGGSADHDKEIRDFIDRVRSGGYVA